MTVFDILRYKYTDLESSEEVSALPEELIELYWLAAHDQHAQVPSKTYSMKEKIRLMVSWADGVAELGWPATAFDIALKKYNPYKL